MPRAVAILLVALWASIALAAPTPRGGLTKRHFKVQSKGRHQRSGRDELIRAYRKHGWEIVIIDPNDPWAGIFGNGGSSPEPYELPTQSIQPPYGLPSSQIIPIGTGFSSSVAAPVPTGFTSSVVAPVPTGLSSAPPYPSGGSPSGYGSGAPSGTGLDSQYPRPTGGSAAPAPASSDVPAPSASNSAGSGEDTGEVAATPESGGSYYISPVSIGGQTLQLDFDTGSADLWVYSTSTPSSAVNGHTVFDPSKSSSFEVYQQGSWEISYGDGSGASGTVGFDKVSVGDASVTRQAIELATQVSKAFTQNSDMDGLLGLGFSNINTIQPQSQKTFFENVMDELDQPLFTADLDTDASGSYEFGTIDKSKYKGQLQYADIDSSSGYWQFESNSYSIGDTESQCQGCDPAILDTGTTLILVEDATVQAYYAQVDGAEYDQQQMGYVFPCDADLPDFTVAIGSAKATARGETVVYAPIDTNGETCFGGIQSNEGQGVQIFGDILLKDIFVVFDGQGPRVGIADKA